MQAHVLPMDNAATHKVNSGVTAVYCARVCICASTRTHTICGMSIPGRFVFCLLLRGVVVVSFFLFFLILCICVLYTGVVVGFFSIVRF